jgi:hypothetical protein
MSKDQRKSDRKLVRNAQELKVMMDTKGWSTIAKPLLDKMIADVVGYRKPTGEWVTGSFGKTHLSAENLVWYRQALMDFNNHLYGAFTLAETAKKNLKHKKPDAFNSPMEDSEYNIEGSEIETNYGGAINE